jgi:hypothetical protein
LTLIFKPVFGCDSKYFIGELMFTKIKEFFLGKPAAEAQAPYKIEAPQETHVEVAPVVAKPVVAKPVVAKPAVMKAAPKPKQPAAKKPAVKKPAAKKPV